MDHFLEMNWNKQQQKRRQTKACSRLGFSQPLFSHKVLRTRFLFRETICLTLWKQGWEINCHHITSACITAIQMVTASKASSLSLTSPAYTSLSIHGKDIGRCKGLGKKISFQLHNLGTNSNRAVYSGSGIYRSGTPGEYPGRQRRWVWDDMKLEEFSAVSRNPQCPHIHIYLSSSCS